MWRSEVSTSAGKWHVVGWSWNGKPAGDMDVLYLANVVCCQVQVCASGRSLVQRSPTNYGVFECDRETSIMGRPWPNGGCRFMGENKTSTADYYMHTWMYICIWSCIANCYTLCVHGLATAQFMVCKIQYLAMLHQLQNFILTEMIRGLCTGLLCDMFEQLVRSTRKNGVRSQATITLTKELVTKMMKQCWVICTGYT
jgi:hypothetical protein